MGKTTIIQKMEAEPRPERLLFYHDLEHIRTPVAFVETVLQDAHAHLSGKGRKVAWVRKALPKLGQTQLGPLRLPEIAAQDWKTSLTDIAANLNKYQVIFLWDELPMMLENVKKDMGETAAMEILDTLRSLRQTYPNFRMIYTGSIGLHHVITSLKQVGYANAPANDMRTIEVPPLSQDHAQELARRLLRGESILTEDRDRVCAEIARVTDGIPFYIHHIVAQLKQIREKVTIETVEVAIAACLRSPHLEMRHYRERIDIYYAEEGTIALNLLDVLAIETAPLRFAEVFNRLVSRSVLSDQQKESTLSILQRLQRDHYVEFYADGTYAFRFPLIRHWWRLHRDLEP